MRTLVLAAILLSLIACDKDDDNRSEVYTYKAQCTACLVQYKNPLGIFQRDTVIGLWQHGVYVTPGSSLRMDLRNIGTEGSMSATIVRDDETLAGSNGTSGTVTAEASAN